MKNKINSSCINLKHPLWKFKKTKIGYVGIVKTNYWNKLINLISKKSMNKYIEEKQDFGSKFERFSKTISDATKEFEDIIRQQERDRICEMIEGSIKGKLDDGYYHFGKNATNDRDEAYFTEQVLNSTISAIKELK